MDGHYRHTTIGMPQEPVTTFDACHDKASATRSRNQLPALLRPHRRSRVDRDSLHPDKNERFRCGILSWRGGDHKDAFGAKFNIGVHSRATDGGAGC